MPGYNHPADCTCGWCFKAGSTSELTELSANRWAATNKITKSFTSCFVTPNAICPVCGSDVFYYQNASGGRVFFDELGWPWPKHPCTDNTDRAPMAVLSPAIRSDVEIREAKRVIQFLGNGECDRDRGCSVHTNHDLIYIESTRMAKGRTIATVFYLDPDRGTYFDIAYAVGKGPSTGSIASLSGDTLSWLNSELIPECIQIG